MGNCEPGTLDEDHIPEQYFGHLNDQLLISCGAQASQKKPFMGSSSLWGPQVTGAAAPASKALPQTWLGTLRESRHPLRLKSSHWAHCPHMPILLLKRDENEHQNT